MRLEDFHFNLPEELIAQTAASPRDQARLLVYDRLKDTIEQARVADLPTFLPPQSLIVANNSRVRKARLWGKNQAGQLLEIMVLEKAQAQPDCFNCLLGGKKLVTESPITVYKDKTRTEAVNLTARILERHSDPRMNTYLVQFHCPDLPIETALERYGQTPLPPYITQESESERYQTVFASQLGSAAAPTAGLHFTPELIRKLQEQDISWEEVTLHVGLGTFLPLRENEVESNRLHYETTLVEEPVAATINKIVNEKKRLLAIGTTTTRTLESRAQTTGQITSGLEQTNLFIYPGYQFRAVNTLLTNFHLPHSSLLLLVAAFLGNHPDRSGLISKPEAMIAKLQELYRFAIREKYRFYSFGDAMLIL